MDKIKRIFRYITIYSFTRTLVKIFGRLRYDFPFWIFLYFPRYIRNGKTIGFIGCGHHSFSSLAFFLATKTNFKIIWAFDININAVKSFSKTYNVNNPKINLNLDEYDIPDIVYIVSNHNTHTEYAIKYIKLGCDVYIEKPISVNMIQFNELSKVIRNSTSKVYVGYNRPFSKAIKLIKKINESSGNKPFTLNCFVVGHFISDDHWYRDPNEGSRVVSNLGHWIDLFVHVYYWNKNFPEYLDINIVYADKNQPSDNISVNISSSNKDLISLVFTTRNEPYEGVNETINFQCGNVNAKINDFRSIEIWKDDLYINKKYFPKDNGHNLSALQPKFNNNMRPWDELEMSTRVMLFIEEMVNNTCNYKRFNK
jgi:predicted dehydrogenase